MTRSLLTFTFAVIGLQALPAFGMLGRVSRVVIVGARHASTYVPYGETVPGAHNYNSMIARDLPAFKKEIADKCPRYLDHYPIVQGSMADTNMLHLATILGWSEGVEALLERGANPNQIRDHGNKAALHWAVGPWANTAIVKALIKGGADVNQRDLYGNAPLKIARWYNQPEIAKMLRDGGAKENPWFIDAKKAVRNFFNENY